MYEVICIEEIMIVKWLYSKYNKVGNKLATENQ